MGKPTMVRPRFILEDQPSMGWRSVYLVNEAGQLLNTEPVCAYPIQYHDWFGLWIVKQDVPIELPDVKPDPAALKKEAKQILDKGKKKP